MVTCAVRESLKPSVQTDDRSLIDEHVARVEVHPEQVVIELAQGEKTGRAVSRADRTLRVPWRKAAQKQHREILVPIDIGTRCARPIRSETRATLVASIARGRLWLDELMSDASATTQAIAKRERCSVRKVNMTISLAFLAPNLVKAAIEGRLPHGMGVSRLTDSPAEWSRQHQMLGLPEQ
jgi:site-specific DNA recombinase